MEVITESAQETQALGRKIGSSLRGGILALVGELGAGKTTFVQGLAEGLGLKARIISPTFILMRKYGENFYHLDLYRLKGDVWGEVENLGVTDIWSDPKNIMVIEWAEKIAEKLPAETNWIQFEQIGEGRRKVLIK